MGFDLHGINPHNPNNAVKPKIDWDKPQSEKERDDYFKKLEEYESQVVGDYFRANVWYWRPLASYVINYTNCVSDEDAEKWSYNDGHEVDEETAIQISNQLNALIKKGHTKAFEKGYEDERKKEEKHNDKVEKELEKFCKSVKDKLGKADLVPADFPKEDHDEWERIYRKRKSGASYPFSVQVVKEFADFCRYSGGFRIC